MAKIGRNDPCPCNSGKKYKKCCLVSDEAAARAAQPAAVPARRPSLASYLQEHDERDELTEASNASVRTVSACAEAGIAMPSSRVASARNATDGRCRR